MTTARADVRAQHERAPVEPVAEDARREQERDRRDGHPDPEERERGRRVPELVRLPGHRDEEDAVAEERDGHPGPEQAEVAVAERGEEVDPREAARAVERLVTMLHAAAARRSPLAGVEVLDQRLVVHRLGEQEALAELAAEVAKRRDLLGQLDSLGDDVEVEAVAERDDRRGQARLRRARTRGTSGPS